ncbi:MAG: glycoside hydrolase [Candidatus Eremiobacteraeota bacterium]|nr:glycoside hydrolase [Candidatus Eremiobacteraeota bacterium]
MGTHAAMARVWVAAALLCTAALVASSCGGGSSLPSLPGPGPVPSPLTSDVTRISSDPFANPSSQHATQVEPDAFAFGNTIVVAFQSGRFFTAGASDIMFATSHDGGATFTTGALPGTTNIVQPGSPFGSVSDPSVAYDAAHGVWLIASLPIVFRGTPAPAALVSRSTDGILWNSPVAVAPGQLSSDKEWIVCDNTLSSPFYGHCYVEWDDPSANGLIHMSTSADGGLTWGPARNTANLATGIGGQPLVQPNGTVVVPIADFNEQNLLAFGSHDGGASWTAAALVTPVFDHFDAGGMRSGPLPSAAIDAAGTVYMVWQDCRFRSGCSANDIVMSTSVGGASWTPVTRVPIDPVASSVDHFLPGIGIAPGTSGASARLGITYFYYPTTVCSTAASAPCLLNVGFLSSLDGGATWSTPVALAGPMSLSWLAQTNIGSMVGDYTTTVYVGTQPHGFFSVAHAPSSALDEAMYTSKAGVIALIAGHRSSAADRPIAGAHSDHPPRRLPPIRQ